MAQVSQGCATKSLAGSVGPFVLCLRLTRLYWIGKEVRSMHTLGDQGK